MALPCIVPSRRVSWLSTRASARVAGALALTALVAPSQGLSKDTEQDAHDHAVEAMDGLGAHVHGVARLQIAQDGPRVLVELITPAVNLVGFEHAPQTDAQRDEVARAQARLETPRALMAFNGRAGCRVDSAQVDMAGMGSADVPKAADDHDHAHDHDHDHGGDNVHGHATTPDPHGAHTGEHTGEHQVGQNTGARPDEAGAGAGDAHGTPAAHRDVVARYSFRCARVDRLSWVEVRMLAAFPLTERVDVTLVGDWGQAAARITRPSARIDL